MAHFENKYVGPTHNWNIQAVRECGGKPVPGHTKKIYLVFQKLSSLGQKTKNKHPVMPFRFSFLRMTLSHAPIAASSLKLQHNWSNFHTLFSYQK